MPRLSAVLITLDEELDIGRALDALAFADEVMVVDSGSTDRTVQICQARGARVVARPFDGFGPQKRFAVSQAANDWVLCIDADEVVTPDLAVSIQSLLEAGEPPLPAYEFRFITHFMGRPLSHGAIARKAHVRLFDRRRARWTDARIHESVEVDGPVGRLSGDVHHHTVRNLGEAIRKLDAYSTEAGRALHARGRSRSALATALTGAAHFLRHWLLRGNFLNGTPGLAFSLMLAAGSMLKYLKADELRAMERARPRHALRPRAQSAAP
jgi:glycosyltransferase involved in cell wall biosynthesis